MSADLEFFQDLPKIRLSPMKQYSFDAKEECRTPTSEEHKIPAILCCPPAPRKPRTRTVSCKRKLAELEFFEIKNREEVEAFLKSSFELEGIRSSMKRNRNNNIMTSCK